MFKDWDWHFVTLCVTAVILVSIMARCSVEVWH